MPLLTKQVIAHYVRTECQRRLRLDLSPDNARFRRERAAQAMPEPQQPRPGLQLLAEAGNQWEAAKLEELDRLFGERAILGSATRDASGVRFADCDLATTLAGARAGHFIVRPRFTVGSTMRTALEIDDLTSDYGLEYGSLVPDLLQVSAPQPGPAHAVATNGNTEPLTAGDRRLRLRVIDIKLTAEPNPGYFSEIVFYSIALAGWLVDAGLQDRFVVTSDAAIWPGAHGASELAQYTHRCRQTGAPATPQGLRSALDGDLEPAPFEVFAFRLRRMLRDDIRFVLSKPWHELEWHVDNRCSGCDYLGYPWVGGDGNLTSRPDHCMPQAESAGQLSRVAFISRGSRSVLTDQGVTTVSALAGLDSAATEFEGHQTLRASRTVLPRRAGALLDAVAVVPPDTGSSGVMPKWADLRIYLTCDFDVGSGISFAFGAKAFWRETRPFGASEVPPRQTRGWEARTFVVPARSVGDERDQFLAFLTHLNGILTAPEVVANAPSLQVYIWDRLTYKHLCRVVGRHLDAILAQGRLAHLAWLFPAEDLMPNADHETSASPITIVQDVAKAVLAAPVPHYYNLFRVARSYHEATLPEGVARFSVHPLFEDEFSDHVPSERAHEIWTKSTAERSYWVRQVARLEETVGKRLSALETVTKRLETDLRALLGKNAAAFPLNPPARAGGMSIDGELWLAYHRLNTALEQLEVAQTRAMPPHEREARHRSIRLERRLSGAEESAALRAMGLHPVTGRRVYRMRPGSREAKFQPGDFTVCISPEGQPGLLDQPFFAVARRAGVPCENFETRWRMDDALAVSIAGLDRTQGWVAVDCRAFRRPLMLDELEDAGVMDLGRDAILDARHLDIFGPKLVAALKALGNPPAAADRPLARRALGTFTWPRPPRVTGHVPAADFIWEAGTTQDQASGRDVGVARARLLAAGVRLNPSQWEALENALGRRLHLIWGPPGTGKSHTLRATLLGAVLEADAAGGPLRILLTAFTWNAIDNVLYELLDDLALHAPGLVAAYRLRSPSRPADVPDRHAGIDAMLEHRSPSPQILDLMNRLLDATGITIVASTPDQVANLLKVENSTRESLFDLIAVDEASQMDVAHAIVAFSSLAPEASVVLAGDPQQLAPIHQAEPPTGLETLLGSIYRFFSDSHSVRHTMLATNYRSNDTIVEFTRMAGYEASLHAHAPDLKLNLLSPAPVTRPADWPASLFWTPAWADLLDPEKAACCFVYPEGSSSQWNAFEADAVAAMALILSDRLADRPTGERSFDGELLLASTTPMGREGLWRRGLGIVTPHRAQQGLVVNRLAEVLGPLGHPETLIRSAVDTVEKFQGQERDVMIASFALGDPDSIRDEDEFLFSLNRFNVMASRARAKLVVLVTQQVVDHLAAEVDVMRESKLLKMFVESYCRTSAELSLAHLPGGVVRTFSGLLKWR